MTAPECEEVIIRPMRESDVPAAMSILEKWNMAPRPGHPEAERTDLVIDQSFVAVCGERVMGTASYLMLGDHAAETASLAVDPESRGLGLGHRLQEARLRAMWQRGVRRVRTETDRPETIRWYTEKFGYTQVGTNPKKHEFSLHGVDHWVVLELDLTEWVREHPER